MNWTKSVAISRVMAESRYERMGSGTIENRLVTFQRVVDVEGGECVQINIIQIDFRDETEQVSCFGCELQCSIDTAMQDGHITAFLLFERRWNSRENWRRHLRERKHEWWSRRSSASSLPIAVRRSAWIEEVPHEFHSHLHDSSVIYYRYRSVTRCILSDCQSLHQSKWRKNRFIIWHATERQTRSRCLQRIDSLLVIYLDIVFVHADMIQNNQSIK